MKMLAFLLAIGCFAVSAIASESPSPGKIPSFYEDAAPVSIHHIGEKRGFHDGEIISEFMLECKERVPSEEEARMRSSLSYRVSIESVTSVVEEQDIQMRSIVVQEGMTAALDFNNGFPKGFLASDMGHHSLHPDILSAALGFPVRGIYRTSGEISVPALRKGSIVLVPRYQLINYRIYSKPRRSAGNAKVWSMIAKGTVRRPEALVAIWRDEK